MSDELDKMIRAAQRKTERATKHRDKALAERNRLIRQASAEGASLRALGAITGLTHTAIRFIVHQEDTP